MMRDKLSKREDRALHRALAAIVMTQYPNPERNDCPGPTVLRGIATKSISMRDPAIDHVGHCSPCFVELTDLRHALRRKAIIWKTGSATAAVLVLALLVNYFGFQRGEPTSPDRIQTPYEVATIDLRNASTARSVQQPGTAAQPRVEIPRAILSVVIQLPIGSEAGAYEIELRQSAQLTKFAGTANAIIKEGITTLQLSIDTRVFASGDYELAWRMPGFDWRTYVVHIQ